MFRAVGVLGRALGIWWQHIGPLTLFNVAWLLLQVPIVTGPPATAAMYVLARRVADGELVEPADGWRALRQMWWPAWRWGLLNLVVLGVVVGNFYAYQALTGWAWVALRLVWGSIAVVWLAVNLFYWPFWLSQTDRRVTTTLRNGLLLVAKSPAFALTLLVVCALLAAGSVLVTLPLAVALMALLALTGTLAVDVALSALPVRPTAPNPAAKVEPS